MQKKDIIQLYIVGTLIIVLVVLTIRVFSGKKRRPPSAAALKSAGEAVAAKQGGATKELFTMLEEEVWGVELRRDPFFKQAQGLLSGPSLEGIVWDSRSPTAVINNKIVGLGSQIKGYTVVDIQKDRVILNDNVRNIKIPLKLFE
ncbi:MAG: hypothetical protein KAS92_00105 [Candidatus Omnitrophica bacterium]|nr:hypothetical protein [Candidatus Omnitrophota bacterium]